MANAARSWTADRRPSEWQRRQKGMRLRGVNAVGRRLTVCAAAPIPSAPKPPDTIWASFAATGRGWRHPTSHVQTAGALEGEEMARDPGGLLRRLPPGWQ